MLKMHSDVTTLQTSFRPFSFSSDFMASVETISFLPLEIRRIKVTVKEVNFGSLSIQTTPKHMCDFQF